MTDSDPKPKSSGVPSWQLKATDTPAKPEPTEPAKPEPEESREAIISQGRRFLEEDAVKDANTGKKIEFLESKGLRSEEIDALLGISRNEEATSPQSSPTTESPTSPPRSTPAQAQQVSRPSQTRSEPSGPPIITYPEFLAVPPSPTNPPLITTPRLLRVLTAFSTLSVLLYGTSKYLVSPMVQSLTESRLSLAATTLSNLEKLNTKLESAVSEIPPTIGKEKGGPVDEDSEDEDPSEMFHRDIGVQTSPPASPSSSFSLPTDPPSATSTLERQSARLLSLRSSLEEALDSSTSEGHDATELEGTISVLREYLDSMAFASPSYAGSSYGIYGGSYAGGNNGKEEDEISRVKASIRGVKGVLLSARSFPGGAGVRAGGR